MTVFLIIPAVLAVVWCVSLWSAGGDPFFMLRRRVYLTDFAGEVRRSRLRTDRDGTLWCHVYAATGTGHVILMPDGMTRGESSYIKRWSFDRLGKEALDKATARNRRYIADRG